MDLEERGRDPVELSSLKFLRWTEEYHKIHQYSRCLYRSSKHKAPRTILLLRYHYTSLLCGNLLVGKY